MTTSIDSDYIKATENINKFAYDYYQAIENSFNIEGKFAKWLNQIFLYPARFMLKYNAVERVKKLCLHLILKASVCDEQLDDWVFDQNKCVSETFEDYYNAGDAVKLIFGLASSLSIFPIIYTILTNILPPFEILIPFLTSFDLNNLFVIVLFNVTLICMFNFIEYTRLRGSLKDKFNAIKKEIAKLA